MAKNKWIGFRVTEAQRQLLHENAKRAGQTLTEYILAVGLTGGASAKTVS